MDIAMLSIFYVNLTSNESNKTNLQVYFVGLINMGTFTSHH
jgi:hypothetical protein